MFFNTVLRKLELAFLLHREEGYEGLIMIALRDVSHTKSVLLSMLFLTLFLSLVSLVSCTQQEPAFTSLNLGITAAERGLKRSRSPEAMCESEKET